jgi:hypothetical protein
MAVPMDGHFEARWGVAWQNLQRKISRVSCVCVLWSTFKLRGLWRWCFTWSSEILTSIIIYSCSSNSLNHHLHLHFHFHLLYNPFPLCPSQRRVYSKTLQYLARMISKSRVYYGSFFISQLFMASFLHRNGSCLISHASCLMSLSALSLALHAETSNALANPARYETTFVNHRFSVVA